MHTFRKRGGSNIDSFGSTGFITGGLALLLAMGCSATAGNGGDMPGLTSNGGGAGIPNGFAGMNVQPFTGACPSAVFQKCKACHDGRGTAGSPMGLVFFEDFHAPSHSNPSAQVYQILSARLHRTTPSPMPPDGMLDPATLQSVDAWTAAGAPDCGGFTHKPVQMTGAGGSVVNGGGGAGNTPFGAGGSVILPPGSGGMPINPGSGGVPITPGGGGSAGMQGGGNGGTAPYDVTPYLSPDGTYFIKEPPGNTPVGPDAKNADYCFNLVAHNAQTPLPSDPTPFQVGQKEFYHAFQYKAPYSKTSWALSTRPIIDNNKVLHHWLLFQMGSAGTDGSHGDEIGLQLNNAMLTGWAPGGNPLDMPAGVGLEMPAVGGFFSMEIHYFNTAGPPAQDRSGVRVCVTYTQPQNPASLTWLGTETINIPANAMGTATGTCSTWKKNGDVHIIQSVPHMHKTGSHMKTVINHQGGGTDILVDQPFVFSDQRAYPTTVTVKATDTLTTTCTFQNPTSAPISFGTSTTAEMCYNFVVYYPAHALDGRGGIEGSTNMCLF